MMLLKRETVSALTIAAALFVQTDTAQACACCTDPGQRFEMTGPYDTYIVGEMDRMRFAPTATLYSNPGFPESVEGLRDPTEQPYGVRATIGNVVTFVFTDPKGRVGRLQFPLPKVMSRFEVDPRASTAPVPPNGPTLYKEWRLQRTASFGGQMTTGTAPVIATLILHGEGNSCSSSSDFKRWTLIVKGPNVAFTFLGDLLP